MEYNLADMFESVVDAVGDREALVAEGRRLTYRELDRRTNRLAHHLRGAGVSPGDHVGCHMKNGTEYLETMLACFKIRAVPINVNYRYVEEELRYLYDDADLVATVVDAEFVDRVAAVAPEIETLDHVVVVGAPGGVSLLPDDLGVTGYGEALAEASPDRAGLPTRSADDLMMIYTGGTTGFPKGVMWRQEDIFFAGMGGGYPAGEPVSSPEEVAPRAADNDYATSFPAPPLMHGAAELASFISFLTGQKVVLVRDYSGHGALELVEQEDVLTMTIVGDAMALPLIQAADERDYDTSSLLAIGSAGAVLSESVRDKLRERFPNVVINDSFGASEVGYTGSQTEDSSTEDGLKFRANPSTAIITEDLEIAEPGEIGRVAQKGHIPVGYYNDAEKTAETFVEVDGERWVLLGDMATMDADGVLHFIGRGSVCINSGGEKIYPEEVEAALKAHPAIEDAVVAGIPDERWGERVAAVLQAGPDADAPPDHGEIEDHLADRVARYKVPRLVHYVDRIERSPSGKPDYTWARETLQGARVGESPVRASG